MIVMGRRWLVRAHCEEHGDFGETDDAMFWLRSSAYRHIEEFEAKHEPCWLIPYDKGGLGAVIQCIDLKKRMRKEWYLR